MVPLPKGTEEIEEISDEDLEEQFEPPRVATPRKKVVKQGLRRAPVRQKAIPKAPAQVQLPQERYQAFSSPKVDGIIDVETNELIATSHWTALAEVLTRLERIENFLGSMIDN